MAEAQGTRKEEEVAAQPVAQGDSSPQTVEMAEMALEPSAQGDSSWEISITSGDSLKRRLSSSNVNIKELIDVFWKSSPDWNVRAKVVAGLMFSAAGCHTLNYEDLDAYDTENVPSGEEANKIEERPQILNPSFTSTYSTFFCELFKMIPLQEAGIFFLRNVVKVISGMISNPWDSVRIAGACAGIKLLTVCMKIVGSPRLESSGTSSESSSSSNASYVKKQFDSLKNILETGVLKTAVRDVFVSIRALAFREMTIWAERDPRVLLDGVLPNSLHFGLHDRRECAIHALDAIKVLFKEDLQDPRQIAFFEEIQDVLVLHLGSNGRFAAVAMSILASAVRFIRKTPNMRPIIFLSVFHKFRSVAVDAAKYIFIVNGMERDVSDPLVVMKKLLIFLVEARETVSNYEAREDMMMDAFHPILKEYVTLEHWEQMLSSSEAEETVLVAKMFFCYVRKTTTNYNPPGRVRHGEFTNKKDLLSAANGFTAFIARTWRKFYSMDKIRRNPEAMSIFTRSMTFTNASLPSDVAFDIIKYLSQLAKVSSHEAELSSAWAVIPLLLKTIPWDSATVMHLKSIFDSLKNGVVEEFSQILHHSSLMMGSDFEESKMRLLYVIRFIEPQDNFRSLWDACSSALDSHCENTELDVPKVGRILEVLHGIVIRQFKALTVGTSSDDCSIEGSASDSQTSGSTELSLLLVSHGQYIQRMAVRFLQTCEPLRTLSFDMLVDMVVCFGKHVAVNPNLLIISDSLGSEIEPLLVKSASSAARAMDCSQSGVLNRGESSCCHILKHTCELFAMGVIDILNFGELLSCTGVNETHDLMIMSALKEFAARYPVRHLSIGAAIAAGLHEVMIEKLKAADENDSPDEKCKKAVDALNERGMYWLTMVDFLAVLKNKKIIDIAKHMLRKIAIRTNNKHLLSTTSELLLSINRTSKPQTSARSSSGGASGSGLASARRSTMPPSAPTTGPLYRPKT